MDVSLDHTINQSQYRSMIAAYSRNTKKPSNVRSKVALFEKLKNTGEKLSPKTSTELPRPLKLTDNMDLLKAFTLFSSYQANLNLNKSCDDYSIDSILFKNDEFIETCKKRTRTSVFCSTPRDIHSDSLPNLLSPKHKCISLSNIYNEIDNNSSSTLSTDAGLGDDYSTENVVDTNTTSSNDYSNDTVKENKKTQVSTSTTTTIKPAKPNAPITMSPSFEVFLVDKTENIKQTAIKLNEERLNLIENDKLIRERYDKLKTKLVFEEKFDENLNALTHKINDNTFASNLTVKIQVKDNNCQVRIFKMNNDAISARNVKMSTSEERPFNNKNDLIITNSLAERQQDEDGKYQIKNHVRFNTQNGVKQSTTKNGVVVREAVIQNDNVNSAENGKIVEEKKEKTYKFPIVEFVFDEKLLNGNSSNGHKYPDVNLYEKRQASDKSNSLRHSLPSSVNEPPKKSTVQIVNKVATRSKLINQPTPDSVTLPPTPIATITPVSSATSVKSTLKQQAPPPPIIKTLPPRPPQPQSTPQSDNNEENKNRTMHIPIIPIEFQDSKPNTNTHSLPIHRNSSPIQYKSIQLTNSDSTPEIQVVKMRRAVPVEINHQPKQEIFQNQEDNKTAKKLWRRTSKIGYENEKELSNIFKRIYERNVTNMASPANSTTSLPARSRLSLNQSNNNNTENTNRYSFPIETYSNKDGKLVSKC